MQQFDDVAAGKHRGVGCEGDDGDARRAEQGDCGKRNEANRAGDAPGVCRPGFMIIDGGAAAEGLSTIRLLCLRPSPPSPPAFAAPGSSSI
jgi:hypothetical protein